MGGFEFYSQSIWLKIKVIVCIILSWPEMLSHPLVASCEIPVASAKFLVALATRKAQFQTLANLSAAYRFAETKTTGSF